MTQEHDQQLRGWVIVGVVFLAMGSSIGAAQYAFGLFVEPLEETFGWSRTQISASLSFIAVSSLIAPLLGRFMDRYGARWLLVGSLTLSAVSYLLRPFMTELWHWYALSFFQFMAFSGATILPTGRLVAIWFNNRRGRVMGIATAGPNVGGFFIPIVLTAVLAASDWRWGYVAIGLLLLAIAIFGWIVVRERPNAMITAAARSGADASAGLTGWEVRDVLRSRSFYLITFATVAGFFTYGAVLPHVFVHLTNEGFTVAKASWALGTLAIGGIGGKLFFGYLSERITARLAFVIDLAGQALFTWLLVATTSAELPLVVPVYGFFLGGVGVLAPLIVQEFYGIKRYGSISGLSSTANVLSFGLGPLLAGLSFDRTGSYNTAFLIAASLFAAGAVLLMLARQEPMPAAAPSS